MMHALFVLILAAGAIAQDFDVPLDEPTPPKPAAPAPTNTDALIDAGFSLEPANAGPIVGQVLPHSPAADLGLAPGDMLWYLNARRIRSRDDAVAALAGWTPGTRVSAVVSRAHRISLLSTRAQPPREIGKRGAANMTPRERLLGAEHLRSAAKQRAPSFRAPDFPVEKGETIWLRFPKGLPRWLERGAVVEAETATTLTTDKMLDFVALPHGSRVWFQVLSKQTAARIHIVRLHAFKLRPKDGRDYAISAIIDEISGDRRLLRADSGGTIVASVPGKASVLAEPERSFRMRFLKGFTLYEPSDYYRAGPGLWFRTVGRDKTRAFEITRIIPGRSADRAGLKVGDRIFRIDGTWAIQLNFSEAVGKLYGDAGSTVRLHFVRKKGLRIEKIDLMRGVRYADGVEDPIPLAPPPDAKKRRSR